MVPTFIYLPRVCAQKGKIASAECSAGVREGEKTSRGWKGPNLATFLPYRKKKVNDLQITSTPQEPSRDTGSGEEIDKKFTAMIALPLQYCTINRI